MHPSGRPHLIVTASAEEAARRAAAVTAATVRAAVERQGICRVALAGGSTPRRLFAELANPAASGGRSGRVPWDDVRFFFGDERTVPPNDPASNYGMAREALFEPLRVPPEHVWRIEGECPDPAEAAARYERDLRQAFAGASARWPRFDLVLLGLGADAHTASWFPGTSLAGGCADGVGDDERWVASVWVPRLQAHRITLTPPVVNAAAHVLFLVVGADKAGAVARVLDAAGDARLAPARLVAPRDGAVTWVVDRAAARAVPGTDGPRRD